MDQQYEDFKKQVKDSSEKRALLLGLLSVSRGKDTFIQCG